MGAFWQDLRYGFRMLAKSPGFTAIAVLTLALGIGANTAIFSLINGMLLGSLPVRDAQSLVLLKWRAHTSPKIHSSRSYGDCERRFTSVNATGCSFSQRFVKDVSAMSNVFSGVATFAGAGHLDLSGNGPASVIDGQVVSGGFFQTLGIRTFVGRTILPSDDAPGASPVVMLNYGYWQNAFGGSPSAIGKTIHLNGVAFTIVGVADPKFTGISPGSAYDVWLPFSVYPRITVGFTPRDVDAGSWWIVMLGRLKPGVAVGQAQSAVSLLFRNEMLHGEKPLFKAEDDPAVDLLPAQQALVGERRQLSAPLYALMLAVGIILLIACANVAGLTLARSAARRKEMAVRRALGASRVRIARQLLTECLLLSLGGGALGLLFAVWGVTGIVFIVSSMMHSFDQHSLPFAIGIDSRVLVFTAAAALLTGILFGVAPAFRGARIDLTPALKEGEGGSADIAGSRGRWFTLGNSLVVAQVALAVVVLAGAGLMVRTLQNLRNIDPGFDTRNVLLFKIEPELAGYKPANVDSLYADLQGRLAAIPGVASVSYSSMPLLSGSLMITGFHLAGTPKDQESDTDYFPVGPDFFDTMHLRLVSGRTFGPADFQIAAEAEARSRAQRLAPPKPAAKPGTSSASSAPPAPLGPPMPAIVNEEFVRKYFSKGEAIGQRFGQEDASENGPGDPGYVIVGLVRDAKYNNLRREINPTTYVPLSGGGASFELRTAGDPTMAIPGVREVVNKLDANLPITHVVTQSKQIDLLLIQEQVIARLASIFGMLALVLASIGLYGLLAFEVARRTREIGIRMALGAQQRDVLRLVVGQGIALAASGAVVGIAAALGVMRFLGALLYGVKPADPVTFAAVGILLALVALAACYIPARRATRVDPMVALRYE